MKSPFTFEAGPSTAFQRDQFEDAFEIESAPEDERIIDLTAQADKSRRKGVRDPKKVWALVLHQMACCYSRRDPLRSYLRTGAHFVILQDGRILQLHPITALLYASNGFNPGSVAVEFAGNFPSTEGRWWFNCQKDPKTGDLEERENRKCCAYLKTHRGDQKGCEYLSSKRNQVTPAQIEAGRYLVQHLIRTMGLKTILAHRQSSATRENDPGPDIWYYVGQWAVENLGLSDGGSGFKVGTGKSIPDSWRNWGRRSGTKGELMNGRLTFEAEPFALQTNGGCGCSRCRHDAAAEEFEWEEESWASHYPADVRQAIAMGGAVWPLALQRAIKSGIRDSSKLANIAFFMHHPERDGRPISTNEPDANDLITLWKFFREEARKMLAYTPSSSSSSSSSSSYSVTPGQEYGGKWRSTRPPGLSADARQTGADSSALADVRAFAGTQGLGETFVKTVAQMAKTESGARYALPANNFNANPPNLRPPGKAFITAWGVFQFNRDAWTCLFAESERNTRPSYIANGTAGCSGCAGSGGCVMPWDCTPAEEIQKPILLWAQLYRQVRAAGGADGDAAGAIRLFHISPAAKKAWQRRAAASGFAHAWQTEPNLSRVRAFLQKAGVALPGSMPAQELEAEEFEWEGESWTSQYAPDVQQAIAMGGAVWPLALQRAIKSGIRDSSKLANIAFFMHHPERDGRPISPNESGAGDLIALWKFFRDEAKKMLSPSAPASKPSSSGSCGTTIPDVNTLMPESAPGLEAKKPQSHRFGLPETIAALTEIGRRWQIAHPSGPLVRIRDISRCGGGKFSPHDSHRMGIDVDIGLMRSDGRTAAVNFRMQPSKYSQELTQEMVDTIRDNGLLRVHRIWFSDDGIRNVTLDKIHNDHVHVRFCLPSPYNLAAMKKAAYPSDTKGTFAACAT